MKNITTTTLKEKGTQKAHGYFMTAVVNEMNQNKADYYSQKLPNGMQITGIGKKCLKVENNFYSWEDIENAVLYDDEEVDSIMDAILSFIFEDYNEVTETTYTPRRFTREEFLENFDEIKNEIIEHKEYYKTGNICGVGEKAIMIGSGYEAEYIKWEKIVEILEQKTIRDALLYYKGHEEETIFKGWFVVEEDNHLPELLKAGDEYAEEKAFVYRHLQQGDLTVESIRDLAYKQYGFGGSTACEEKIDILIKYALQFVPEIKRHSEPLDEEEENEYCVRNGGDYFFTIKNKEISYKDEAYFTEYRKVTFKIEGDTLEVYRKGKKVATTRPAQKTLYINTRKNQTYELSCEQQLEVYAHFNKNLRKVTEEEIKEDFLDFLTESDSSLAYDINNILMKHHMKNKNLQLEDVYSSSKILQGLARLMYHTSMFSEREYQYLHNALIAEPYIIHNLCEVCVWDDSTAMRGSFISDKYNFDNNTKGNRVALDFNEYTYLQNERYTKISHVSADVDTFAVTDCYYEGSIEVEIPLYYKYAWGVYLLRGVWPYGWIDTETEEKW